MAFGDLERGQAEAFDGVEDIVGRLSPSEGLGIGVDGFDMSFDGRLQFLCRPVNAAPDLLFGQVGEEAFNLIEP